MPLLTPLEGLADVRVPDVLGPFSLPTISSSVGVVDRPERLEPVGRDHRSSPGIALPGGGIGLLALLLIALLTAVGLVSLARLVVGEELFEARHWRGHRS